ncbi:hypothetical protein BDY21DRAFT_364000 [Lineolata rhizophorae]|uniref:Uncharacterized protein n=1 Tax=Lineolata rhizophorae TaxID=578093 RepID=A0A6A6NZV8_9PEZI|nr:hypothetical protein BDY21DRAFT_364000 [Lineolata rhizophorae]
MQGARSGSDDDSLGRSDWSVSPFCARLDLTASAFPLVETSTLPPYPGTPKQARVGSTLTKISTPAASHPSLGDTLSEQARRGEATTRRRWPRGVDYGVLMSVDDSSNNNSCRGSNDNTHDDGDVMRPFSGLRTRAFAFEQPSRAPSGWLLFWSTSERITRRRRRQEDPGLLCPSSRDYV